jgi:hypothetical protein
VTGSLEVRIGNPVGAFRHLFRQCEYRLEPGLEPAFFQVFPETAREFAVDTVCLHRLVVHVVTVGTVVQAGHVGAEQFAIGRAQRGRAAHDLLAGLGERPEDLGA